MASTLRIGEGWDTHALVVGRPLVLGGVTIDHTHGLDGHSDADALLHAITDALLGAAALGDIGRHFPDTDAAFKGADSSVLLAQAARSVGAAGWHVVNIDSTIVAQAPKMAPHIPAMRECIARALGIADRSGEREGQDGREDGAGRRGPGHRGPGRLPAGALSAYSDNTSIVGGMRSRSGSLLMPVPDVTNTRPCGSW